MRGWIAGLLAGAILMTGGASFAAGEDPPPAAAILQDLKAFAQTGAVLHVAAHPDDENTQLITYLSLGRHYRAAYLSLTRGDGGQNQLGPEFGEQLGVVRTQELLAARRIDGGQQFFTRAVDFGFSKDVRQTLQFWDRKQVVGDIVRVIRTFKPDVIVTRFSTVAGGTHGHHTASAVLALEAFGLAGDPKAYPEQLTTLTPWQPKRIFMNSGGFGPAPAGARNRDGGGGGGTVRMDIGGTDPVTGDSFATIAGRSRAMHKTQGFGNFGGGGGGAGGRRGGNAGPRMESFQLLAGEPATNDIMDGVDTTWARVPGGGAEIAREIDDVVAKFDPKDPSASVNALLAIRTRLASLPADRIVEGKRRQLDRIIQACLGLSVESVVSAPQAVPGEPLKLRHVATIRSAVPVRWAAIRFPGGAGPTDAMVLRPNESAARETSPTLPAGTPITQPYWLREPHEPGMFTVSDASMIGLPEAPPAFPIEHSFDVGGQAITVQDEPVYIGADKSSAQARRRLEVIPPVSIGFSRDVRLFTPGKGRAVEVELTASRAGSAGTLQLEVPAGWKVEPARHPFRLNAVGDRTKFAFTVTAPSAPSAAGLTASVEVGGARYSNLRSEIRYDHIPPQLLQPSARVKAVGVELAIRGKQVGYLPGAGDSTADALSEMGYQVVTLSGADLTPDRLKTLDAVVVGVRAFNVRTDLAPHLGDLFAYVEAGGTVVEQYNAPGGLKSSRFGPFDLRLSGSLPPNRVTDPKATVSFLAPDHPALNTPNRITPADFEGWVQERGLNFPSEWDHEHYTALLACSDAGEAPLKSGLLVARHGRGYFVYTGLSFFRQLPAGVPGAYRLFANLVSLGK